ncbi:Rieske 2Fe-2S domain-containing protein [Komagataeibacter rhaeticus DSM 16663]|nr:hypothetical protein GLUCORHAEAF1_10125 [Komagataeibacter rhaeticus AF1]GBQ09171.1 Rieske 2Fe-2S domain-containing protein [Komagataeibacter rhaeticus DSM 16663]SAY46700.1 Methylxanthine N1-demethylase NdmA [Komagataeibacter rhaeticus]
MLATQEPRLRDFWYCLFPMHELSDAPRAFRLLGQDIVVWRDEDGRPHAVIDRCPHRSARLSGGTVEEGRIVCPYHGWAFRGDGRCVSVPQSVTNAGPQFGVKALHCTERYGQVWVCPGEPAFDLPHVPHFEKPGYRQIFEFSEDWACSAQRIIENEFDTAHFSFVHKGSFGDSDPAPARTDITETETGFVAELHFAVRNPEDMRDALQMHDDNTVRNVISRFIMPFYQIAEINYPNGLTNVLVTWLTPVDDGTTRFNQFVMRNDREEDVPASQVRAFDRRITSEDRQVLELTDPMVPLDTSEGVEIHMASDKPGLIMRRRMREFLHGGKKA